MPYNNNYVQAAYNFEFHFIQNRRSDSGFLIFQSGFNGFSKNQAYGLRGEFCGQVDQN